MSVLDDIIARKRVDVEAAKTRVPLAEIRALALDMPPARPFEPALRRPGATALIAEVKRASPSRGVLNRDFSPVEQARLYARNGAAAISCLTEEHRFLADPADLARIHAAVDIPVLRKDFLFDRWQVPESRAMGADAVLLIATSLEVPLLADLLSAADELGLGHIVEVHDEADAERALSVPCRVIGINNRDLRTFDVSLETTRRLASLIRAERPNAVIVSESGIFSADDVRSVRGWGADAVLVGEALMTAGDVPAAVRALATA
jgi:indole-3-glycerol phosphate synthase